MYISYRKLVRGRFLFYKINRLKVLRKLFQPLNSKTVIRVSGKNINLAAIIVKEQVMPLNAIEYSCSVAQIRPENINWNRSQPN